MSSEDIVYAKELVESMPTGTFIHEQVQELRDSLEAAEKDRDDAISLLSAINDATDEEELEDAVARVKRFIEDFEYPSSY